MGKIGNREVFNKMFASVYLSWLSVFLDHRCSKAFHFWPALYEYGLASWWQPPQLDPGVWCSMNTRRRANPRRSFSLARFNCWLYWVSCFCVCHPREGLYVEVGWVSCCPLESCEWIDTQCLENKHIFLLNEFHMSYGRPHFFIVRYTASHLDCLQEHAYCSTTDWVGMNRYFSLKNKYWF